MDYGYNPGEAPVLAGFGPSVAVLGAAGVGAVGMVSGRDEAGGLTLVTGPTGSAAGPVATVSFANPRTSPPSSIVVTPASSSSAGLAVYVAGTRSDGFILATAQALPPATSFSWSYILA